MSTAPLAISGAPFLADPNYRRVIAAIAVDGDRALAVGGSVRNALMGLPITDIDIATTALPETVTARARAAGLKAVPTGIEHGTITVVVDHHPFEVTTLRADVETDGRRATVAFASDFAVDAGRRDFTMNAIYADLDGSLLDPTGGVPDALARRVRYIGDPEARIREDYLRILRFFRFHAAYGAGNPDPNGLAASVALRGGIDRLSRERIGQEMRKLLVAGGAGPTLWLMLETGILDQVLGLSGDVEGFDRLRAAAAGSFTPDPPLALAVLASRNGQTIGMLTEKLRLSNAEQDRLVLLFDLADRLGADPDQEAVRLAVYRHGNEAAAGAILLAAARERSPASPLLDLAQSWKAPKFPITGKHLLEEGLTPGPDLGRRLAELEAAWIASGFGER